MGAQNNNSPGGYGSPWHRKEGHENYTNKIPGKITIHEVQKITLLSTAHLPRLVSPSLETLFASQSPWFGLGY